MLQSVNYNYSISHIEIICDLVFKFASLYHKIIIK